MYIRGFQLFGRASDGSVVLVSYGPQNDTWHWAVYLQERHFEAKPYFFKIYKTPFLERTNQWHHKVIFLWRWMITFAFQDYHKQKRPTHEHRSQQ